ncbi:MAG: UDP-2,3-diacylglucosamine diphosphatase LpxI [Hyphomonadaceae bacterium]|nr:UDP-2,3-diacylglucosamine diphosphatase LpxI [Hyphomonadaceae bacterium]
MAPLGIIAGLGALPVQVAEAATARGQGVYVLRLKGFEEPDLERFPGEVGGIAEIGKAFKAFRQAGCEQICFAGVVKRPDFKALKPDLKGMSLLPKAISVARKGDDALLTFMIKVFEDEGFEIVGANEAAGHLEAPEGVLAGPEPSAEQIQDLKKAAHVALEIGRLDIGQGAIVANGLVLCVEAQEGTDEMLKRCADLPLTIRGSETARLGVLVKRPKPQQERRIDLPTIGKKTLDGAAAAGLAGIGYEAGGALIVDVETVKSHAEALGLFLYGFPQDWDT